MWIMLVLTPEVIVVKYFREDIQKLSCTIARIDWDLDAYSSDKTHCKKINNFIALFYMHI